MISIEHLVEIGAMHQVVFVIDCSWYDGMNIHVNVSGQTRSKKYHIHESLGDDVSEHFEHIIGDIESGYFEDSCESRP
jgi:hypothetical protein